MWKWGQVDPASRADIRLFLMSLLASPPPAKLVVSKLVKVVVEVAKQDWPNEFPDFLPAIQQLTQAPATLPFGLMLIKTMNEEFLSRGDDVAAARKDELRRVHWSWPFQAQDDRGLCTHHWLEVTGAKVLARGSCWSAKWAAFSLCCKTSSTRSLKSQSLPRCASRRPPWAGSPV